MDQLIEVKQKMFQLSLKNNFIHIKDYIIGFVIGILISIIASYMYRDYQLTKSTEVISELTVKIDSLSNEIRFQDMQRADLEQQIKNKKIEIQEVTIIKYRRPNINSPDSSFKYLKGLIK